VSGIASFELSSLKKSKKKFKKFDILSIDNNIKVGVLFIDIAYKPKG
jgi:hypothetical protein